jgi:hypothetical protein
MVQRFVKPLQRALQRLPVYGAEHGGRNSRVLAGKLKRYFADRCALCAAERGGLSESGAIRKRGGVPVSGVAANKAGFQRGFVWRGFKAGVNHLDVWIGLDLIPKAVPAIRGVLPALLHRTSIFQVQETHAQGQRELSTTCGKQLENSSHHSLHTNAQTTLETQDIMQPKSETL